MTRRPIVYGLDIETDTRTNAIDPQVARVRAVALSGDGYDQVFEGDEADLIADLDEHLAALPPGILATWNGAAFDLPFLADRAAVCGVPIGLRLRHDARLGMRRAPLPGHPGAYRAAWYRHHHVDAYRVYRGDSGASPRLPGGLRCLARLAGLRVVEVERDLAVELEREAMHAYAAGDARLARVLVERRWPGARSHIDRRVPDTGPWVPPWFEPRPVVEVDVEADVPVVVGAVPAGRGVRPGVALSDGGDGADVARAVVHADPVADDEVGELEEVEAGEVEVGEVEVVGEPVAVVDDGADLAAEAVTAPGPDVDVDLVAMEAGLPLDAAAAEPDADAQLALPEVAEVPEGDAVAEGDRVDVAVDVVAPDAAGSAGDDDRADTDLVAVETGTASVVEDTRGELDVVALDAGTRPTADDAPVDVDLVAPDAGRDSTGDEDHGVAAPAASLFDQDEVEPTVEADVA